MQQVTISGHSDDCIEIEGDLHDEFYLLGEDDEPSYLAFSDGTVLSVLYDKEGVWRFYQKARGRAVFSKIEGDDDSGTDVVTLADADLNWVVYGPKFARAV